MMVFVLKGSSEDLFTLFYGVNVDLVCGTYLLVPWIFPWAVFFLCEVVEVHVSLLSPCEFILGLPSLTLKVFL